MYKIIDLGNYWEEKTGYPIPLGGIVANKRIDEKLINIVDGLVKKSIKYAFSNYPVIPDFVQQNSQEMDIEVMKKHIDLYVNDYSIDLGDAGKSAIQNLINVFITTNKSLQKVTIEREQEMFAGG